MPYKGNSDNITYPPGCKELSEDLNRDELLRRLKVCNNTLIHIVYFVDRFVHVCNTTWYQSVVA